MPDEADEREIYRRAYLLIEEHGEDAGIHAAMRANEALRSGNIDGYEAWTRVARAVDLLQVASAGSAVH